MNGARAFKEWFALNDTQYGSTDLELQYGAQILAALSADGVPGKHFIVNTDQNGQPYLAGQVKSESNDTPRCTSRSQTLCQRTGIPPTTDIANPRWGLTAADAAIARAEGRQRRRPRPRPRARRPDQRRVLTLHLG